MFANPESWEPNVTPVRMGQPSATTAAKDVSTNVGSLVTSNTRRPVVNLINYDCRVIPDLKIPHITTLE